MSAPVPPSVLRKKLRLRRLAMTVHMAKLGHTVVPRKMYGPMDMLSNWQRHVIARIKGKDSEEAKKLRDQHMGAYLAMCEQEARLGQI